MQGSGVNEAENQSQNASSQQGGEDYGQAQNIVGKQQSSLLRNLLEDFASFLLALVVGIGIWFVVLLILNYFNLISLSSFSPQLSFLPQRSKIGISTNMTNKDKDTVLKVAPPVTSSLAPNLETCSITKQASPLVDDVKTLGSGNNKTVVGTFRGNINKYIYDKASKTAKLELISPGGEQVYTFLLIVSQINQKGSSLRLQELQLLVNSMYNCG